MSFTLLEPRGILTPIEASKSIPGDALPLVQIAAQRIFPVRHFDAIAVQARCRKNRVRRTRRRTRHLRAAHRPDLGIEACAAHDLAREIEPGTFSRIAGVYQPASILCTKCDDGCRQVDGISRSPSL